MIQQIKSVTVLADGSARVNWVAQQAVTGLEVDGYTTLAAADVDTTLIRGYVDRLVQWFKANPVKTTALVTYLLGAVTPEANRLILALIA